MQNMHANGDGGGGEMFIGVVGDRRMRPHNHHLNHQALKCPRCDSVNTKFCYYNNYNLSQPRHFCKSCRRYWTKGGILRSVPVGGGCRKSTKRSNAKSSAGDAPRESKSNARSSSSESSCLTTVAAPAGATTPPTNTTTSTPPTNTTSSTSTATFNLSDAMFSNANPQAYSNLDHVNHTSADGQIFATDIGSFTSLMTSSEEMIGFGKRRIPEQPVNRAAEADNPSAAAVDELDMSSEGLAAALDWGSGGGGSDHGLFDLTAGVDQANWNQSEWTDNDRSVNYLP